MDITRAITPRIVKPDSDHADYLDTPPSHGHQGGWPSRASEADNPKDYLQLLDMGETPNQKLNQNAKS